MCLVVETLYIVIYLYYMQCYYAWIYDFTSIQTFNVYTHTKIIVAIQHNPNYTTFLKIRWIEVIYSSIQCLIRNSYQYY